MTHCIEYTTQWKDFYILVLLISLVLKKLICVFIDPPQPLFQFFPISYNLMGFIFKSTVYNQCSLYVHGCRAILWIMSIKEASLGTYSLKKTYSPSTSNHQLLIGLSQHCCLMNCLPFYNMTSYVLILYKFQAQSNSPCEFIYAVVLSCLTYTSQLHMSMITGSYMSFHSSDMICEFQKEGL